MSPSKHPVAWSDIAARLDDLQPVEGGFSQAERGIVILADGRRVFVKQGLHDNTRAWAKKEIAVYHFLKKQGYCHIPELMAVNDDETGFALSFCGAEDGWDWQEDWTAERLDATLAAMDALAQLRPDDNDRRLFSQTLTSEADDGWRALLASEVLQAKLKDRLRTTGHDDLAQNLDIVAEAARSSRLVFRDDVLTHDDVRADNCAWNAHTKQVCLVDWNWTQLGDRRIDLAALLTHVQKSGLDVLSDYADRLNADALHWMAGFWLKAAMMPIWEGGPPHLRDSQLDSGLTAFALAQTLDTR